MIENYTPIDIRKIHDKWRVIISEDLKKSLNLKDNVIYFMEKNCRVFLFSYPKDGFNFLSKTYIDEQNRIVLKKKVRKILDITKSSFVGFFFNTIDGVETVELSKVILERRRENNQIIKRVSKDYRVVFPKDFQKRIGVDEERIIFLYKLDNGKIGITKNSLYLYKNPISKNKIDMQGRIRLNKEVIKELNIDKGSFVSFSLNPKDFVVEMVKVGK